MKVIEKLKENIYFMTSLKENEIYETNVNEIVIVKVDTTIKTINLNFLHDAFKYIDIICYCYLLRFQFWLQI